MDRIPYVPQLHLGDDLPVIDYDDGLSTWPTSDERPDPEAARTTQES